MCFVDIYKKVEKCKSYSVYELLKKEGIDVIRDDTLINGRQARMMSYEEDIIIFLKEGLSDQAEKNLILHELGHYYLDCKCALANHRKEENNANLFMCLYLIHNEIWDYDYFDRGLIDLGVDYKVASQFNDRVWQYKIQTRYNLAY